MNPEALRIRTMNCRSAGRFRPGPVLALLQSNLPQSRKMSADASELIVGYQRLVEKAVQRIEHHGVDKPVDLTEPLIL